MDRLLVTGGAGFIGSNFVHHVVAHTDAARDGARQADLRRQQGVAGRAARGPGRAGRRRHRRRRRGRPAGRRARRGRPLRRRVAQRQLARRPAPVHPHQPGRHLHDPRGGAQARHARSTTSPPTRCTATSSSTTRSGSPRTRRTTRAARTPRPRPAPTTWSAPGCAASACRRRSPTAPTTTARGSTSRSSSRARSPTSSTAAGRKLYGAGENVRDWIHADDHSSAVLAILEKGRDRRDLPDRRRRREEQPRGRAADPATLMGQPEDDFDHVTDRAGHDLRYAIESGKLRNELGWQPQFEDFEAGLADTIEWYRDARGLVAPAQGRRPRRRTPRRASDGGLPSPRDHADPRPGRAPARPCARTPAAGSRRTGSARRWSRSGCPTSARCRTTSPSTPTAASPAASTPSRGTSSSRSPPAGSSAPGSTCARATRSAPRSPSRSTRRRGLRAPRRRQQLPDARGRHRLHLPRQRALASRRRLPRARPRRPDRRDPVADPARRGEISEKDHANPDARRRRPRWRRRRR